MVLHRESAADTWKTLQAIACAATRPTRVDLLVNGRPTLAVALKSQLEAGVASCGHLHVNVWSIAFGDKAHAWNEYIQNIWCGTGMAFFVDGYARVRPDALEYLALALTNGDVLAASGVPTVGYGAATLKRQMLDEGGMHGNLFVLGASTLRSLRTLGFRLPLGIYRTDATLGAALSFGLDPGACDWAPRRYVRVVAESSWDIDMQPWWRPAELLVQWKRRQRQAQGRLENRAVRYFFAECRQPIASLPRTAADLVQKWATGKPDELFRLRVTSPLVALAWRRLRQPRDFTLAEQAAELVAEWQSPR